MKRVLNAKPKPIIPLTSLNVHGIPVWLKERFKEEVHSMGYSMATALEEILEQWLEYRKGVKKNNNGKGKSGGTVGNTLPPDQEKR